MSNPISYTVQPRDTMGRIAAHFGKSVAELVEINHITNPNRLEVGQVIYLNKHYANSVQVMLMDVLRQPIDGLKTLIKFDGKTVEHISDASGLIPLISTASISSKLEIFVQDRRKEWTKVADAVSGLGQQWLKLISPALKFDLPLRNHDSEAAEQALKPANDKKNPAEGKAKGEPIKKDHPAKKSAGKDHNTIVLDVDIPQELIAYFKLYKDEPIADEDWRPVAKDLVCEREVLMAIAKVESGGKTAFWKLNKDGDLHIPKILYERHKFSLLTQRKFDKTNPDISWPQRYLSRKAMGMNNEQVQAYLKDKMPHDYTHDNHVDIDDVYQGDASSYLLLLNAFRLNKEAALKAASWGKFQILGENHADCGEDDLINFVQTMCSGEKGKLKMLAGFIQMKKPFLKAVQSKDWGNIARNYNGPRYKEGSYDTKLMAAYNDFKNKGSV